ncbi:head decoration protein [Amycolatopsis sp. cmx-4-54]|uniref:Decorator protein D n=1 Tax=Cronobacter phage JC01 TaxID=2729575 RepID=A0A6M3YKE7_9CAUD|nr:decorator protein D [Cronobacter phage JC01]QJI52234.1 decorator protein D [Cronobacter phage JC01]
MLMTLMASLPNLLAGNFDLGSWEPTQIHSGEADIVTDGEPVGVAFAKYQVIARANAGANAGKLVPWDPAGSDGAELAIGIANEAGVPGTYAPYYCGGVFNPDAIVWPASVTSVAARKAAFARTNIQITTLY